MLTNRNTIQVLDKFEIDYKLPKYNDISKTHTNINGSIIGSTGNVIFTTGDTNLSELFVGGKRSFKTLKKIFNYLKEEIDIYFENKRENKISIIKFFENILIEKNNNNINDINEIVNYYNNLLYNAEKANQTALIEKITKQLELVAFESKLINTEYSRFVSEQSIIDFYNKIKDDNSFKKTLKLTYIKNYTKPIPNGVINLKVEADKLIVFDNYVVLHFDPTNENVDFTEEEKNKLADPILFGIIKNSRKLYYIGDWIDEDCNLTLDKLIELTEKNIVTTINKEYLKK